MRTDYNLKEVTLAAFEEFILAMDTQVNYKPAPNKWSAKEILGHLIDSATVNHGRFIRAQFNEELVVESYAQNDWVEVQEYQNQEWQDLLITWRQLNVLISNLMFSTTPEVRDRARGKHNLHQTAFKPVPENEPATLGYFMEDYVAHLKHHLGRIRELVH